MKLIKTKERYEAISKYGEWQAKNAGFRWDPKAKRWWTKDEDKAACLAQYAEGRLRKRLERIFAGANSEREANRAMSRATDADIAIPAPAGENYLPYQRAGIAYAMSQPATIIGDEMGLGKTVQSLGVINFDESIRRVLVICPASLRLNWKRETVKWLTRDLSVGVSEGSHFPSTHVVIINYDILSRHHDRLRRIEWDLMICDEAHLIKNPRAQRTRAVFGWKPSKKDIENARRKKQDEPQPVAPIVAKRRLFLTGTPVVNRPVELHPILRSIDNKRWGNFMSYAKRYCDGQWNGYGWDFSGASNLEELQDKLRESCMVRRLKADVLTDLPPKRRSVIELPPNGCADEVKNEQATMADHAERIEALRVAVELAKASDDQADYNRAVKKLREGHSAEFEAMAKLRHETALAKLPYVVDHVREIADQHKVVVFAHHHDVIDELMNELGTAAVKLDGRDTMAARDQAVQRFQRDPSVKVFVGGIKAAGVGLTLTAAAHVVFAELDWVPGNMSQAEDRCHRIGQNDSVLVQHLVLEGSIDARMAGILIEKQEVIDRVLDLDPGAENRAERDAEEAKKFAPVELPGKRGGGYSKSATKSARQIRIAALANRLTPAHITRIHGKLQTLSALCDGAVAEDGMGFNRFDTVLGKDLASRSSLTPKQAALGWYIANRYRGQVGAVELPPAE